MQQTRQETLLLRTLAAIAWADGSVDARERAFIHGVITEYGLTEAEAEGVFALLENPVSLEEFETYARDFLQSGSEADRSRLLSRAERIIEADGSTDRAELRYLHLLRGWTNEAQTHAPGDEGPVFGRFSRFLGKATSTALGPAVRSLFSGSGAAAVHSPRDAYVALFGALLYRVVYADHVVEAKEAERLRSLLSAQFGFADGEVDTMLRLIQQRVAENHDRQRLCAEFNRVSGPEERQQLLAALFELGGADGEVSSEEEAEIRLISNYLWIEIQDFVSIRKRVIGR